MRNFICFFRTSRASLPEVHYHPCESFIRKEICFRITFFFSNIQFRIPVSSANFCVGVFLVQIPFEFVLKSHLFLQKTISGSFHFVKNSYFRATESFRDLYKRLFFRYSPQNTLIVFESKDHEFFISLQIYITTLSIFQLLKIYYIKFPFLEILVFKSFPFKFPLSIHLLPPRSCFIYLRRCKFAFLCSGIPKEKRSPLDRLCL